MNKLFYISFDDIGGENHDQFIVASSATEAFEIWQSDMGNFDLDFEELVVTARSERLDEYRDLRIFEINFDLEEPGIIHWHTAGENSATVVAFAKVIR
ncbi:MAG: hypothetical protein ACEQSB_00655 [Undibacterium sp.]